MIADDLDRSLHPAEPEPAMLDDGYSAPRASTTVAQQPPVPHGPASLERALAEQSDF
jgi:hypothetical protein